MKVLFKIVMSLVTAMMVFVTAEAQVTTMDFNETSTMVINGKSYSIQAGSVVRMSPEGVFVNGMPIDKIDKAPTPIQISIEIHGNVNSIESDAGNITITGNAESVTTTSGKVQAEQITTVSTMSGSVTAETISGNVKTMSGAIRAKTIKGSTTQQGSNNRQTIIFE